MAGWITLGALAALAGCGGGTHGFAREYSPLGEEDEYFETASPVGYEEVRRDPAAFASSTVGWFGIVANVEADSSGRAVVSLTHRIHQPRHLCQDERASSCRVTVSDRSNGTFTTTLTLRPEERESGEDRLWIGSLVKIYGSPTGQFDAQGGPILEARYHRHWPRGAYVTTGAARSMRR